MSGNALGYSSNASLRETSAAPDIPQTGLALWLKADSTNLFQDTLGATPVTTNGQEVKRWNDSGPAGNNLTQTSGSPVCVWLASAQNSKPGVTFNRSRFDVTALLPGTNAFEVWAVFNEDGGASGSILLGHKTDVLTTGVVYPLAATYYVSATNTAKNGTYYAEHSYTQSGDYTLYKGRAGATLVEAATDDSAWTTASRDQIQVIEWNTVGGHPEQATYGTKGTLCELIVYGANQSAGTRTAIDTYLNTKYALF